MWTFLIPWVWISLKYKILSVSDGALFLVIISLLSTAQSKNSLKGSCIQMLVVLMVLWLQTLICLSLSLLLGWRDNWHKWRDYGSDHLGCRDLHPWPDHQCHSGPEGARGHGCVQLCWKQHFWHHCRVSRASCIKVHITSTTVFVFLEAVKTWPGSQSPKPTNTNRK